MGARMSLEKLARGRPCFLRLPGHCNGNPETTVLCHIRRGGTAGIGMKPPSICASDCHSLYDGRTQDPSYSRTELDAEMLRAHCQWLDYLVKQEIVIVVLAA
jgi:hypothetical protein